ncbi:MAG TPA: proton-conducting transporter membrane subunit [Planctomycetaceae bacterium]|nr:proton-conducting transporter membrane subunit [Planctomycetaceae bacterium]
MNVLAVLPSLIVAIAAGAILLAERFFRRRPFGVALCWLGLLGAAATWAVAKDDPVPERAARADVAAVTVDPLARGTVWMALLLGATCAAVSSLGPPRSNGRLAAVLLSLAGVLLTCVANNFLLVIIGVPVSALALSAGQFWEAETAEERAAAVQALVLNLFASVCLVAGALLVSALAGTNNFAELRALPIHGGTASGHLAARGGRALPLAGEVGAVLLLAGFGIPLLAAPFQLAAAEIFEGAAPWNVGAMAVLPRCAVLVAMIRVFVEGMSRYLSTAQTALTAMALVTLLIGGSLAYWQTSLRRLIALVVMVEAGVILLALAAACSEAARPDAVRWIDQQIPGGSGSAWFLFGADSLAILGLAAILGGLERSVGWLDPLEEFARRLRGDRLIAAATVLLLLTLAGIPPLPSFWARVGILRSVLSVSFPSENDFLPHQNTGYLMFALVMVAAMITVAAACLSLAGRILLSPKPIAEDDVQVSLWGERRAGGLKLGAALALLLLALGFLPTREMQLAARVTFRKADDTALTAEKAAQPIKKRHRGRTAETEEE